MRFLTRLSCRSTSRRSQAQMMIRLCKLVVAKFLAEFGQEIESGAVGMPIKKRLPEAIARSTVNQDATFSGWIV